MADPFSITGLILDVTKIISSVIEYAQTVRHAKAETQRLSEELFALKGMLEHLSSQQLPISTATSDESGPFNLESALRSTDEFLRALLADLEVPATKFKRLQQKLEWPFTRQQFDAHLYRLERVKTCLILVLTSDSASLGRVLRSEVSSLASSLKEDLKIRNEERAQMANSEFLRWLAPVDPVDTHLRVLKGREIGTGRWFIDGHLKKWLSNGDKGRILSLIGKCVRSIHYTGQMLTCIAGTGKTTLL